VTRCASAFFVSFLVLAAAQPAFAATATTKSAKQPVGIFTDDDGDRIIVGVGTTAPLATLDVSRGEVKIGSTGAPCTKMLFGALRATDGRLQFCDGAGWRNVSLDKAQ
jgi:hypothetical protein